LFILLFTLPPVECGKSGGTGDRLMLFFGLEFLLPLPALNAAANAPFAPEYVFTGALALGVFRPNAVEAPSKAALREAVVEVEEEAELLLANVEARAGLRGAAIGAGGLTGGSREHDQDEREVSKRCYPAGFLK
jgi:hypothetical protein